MPEIKVLSSNTVNKIAAGEVVERPASVVKELVENSLDADADEIVVEVKEGGKDLIKVKDNGRGMGEEEVKLAFKKHATSKIEDIDDLDDLSSLGFRGEALPSISAVSKVRAVTKKSEGMEGTEIVIHGGEVQGVDQIGSSEGTIVEVEDLFYNTPAREKYMKKTSTELAHVSEVVTRMALAHPGVKFRLIHDGNELFFSPKTDSVLEKVKNIYGKDIARKMVEVSSEGEISIDGYISKPEITRSNRRHIFTYVNSRFVKNNLLKDSLMDGYRNILPKGRYPIAVIYLEIDGKRIDVNVHPTKTKIRFLNEEEVKDALSEAVRSALLDEDLVPSLEEETTVEKKSDEEETESTRGVQEQLDMEEEVEVKESKLSHMRVTGIVKDTYIIAETPEGMAVIDQHAAHERINYERIKSQTDKVESQRLVSPTTVELKPREAAVLRANEDLLEELGFEIQPFGKTTFRITSLPVILGELQGEEILLSVLDELLELKGTSLDERKEEMVKYMACHSSITAGEMLSKTKAKELLEELGGMENPYTCPHGRPTIVNFSEKELKKWFKRT